MQVKIRYDFTVRRLTAVLALLALSSPLALAVAASQLDPLLDLDYATYRGYFSQEYSINIWKSIRYAAPPVAELRWQAPQPPPKTSSVQNAREQPPLCPQTGAFGTPAVYGFNSGPGNEDCLYLNVYAAPNATNLPVMVWIHGGGHSVFGATYDPSIWMKANGNGFIHVEMQYRLGAFGFLASEEIKQNGALNAGLLDQRYAIEWTKRYISKFGGDPNRITIGGESSGAGSALFHALAYGGRETNLFSNVIASSPYLPPTYDHDDEVPTGNYNAFAEFAGCAHDSINTKKCGSVFKCLVAADTVALQNASGKVSTSRGSFGSFAFLPVVDGDYIRQRPSKQLLLGKVSGKRLLVGTNANEGVPLTNPYVNTRAQYDEYVETTFPDFSPADIFTLNTMYQVDRAKPGNNETRYDTLGDSGPTALHQSGMATGLQQAVFNIAAEAIFQCPAQWMAQAYGGIFGGSNGKRAWKYQYSPTPSYHGADLATYFATAKTTMPSADFRYTIQKIWGSFIINNTPVISAQDATANKHGAEAPISARKLQWPPYTVTDQRMINLNTTGGNTTLVTVTDQLKYYIRTGDDVVNWIRLVDGYKWEGGRGARCDIWRLLAPRVSI